MQPEASRRYSEPAVCVSGGDWDIVPLHNAFLPGTVKLPKRFQRFIKRTNSYRDLEDMQLTNASTCNGTENQESQMADLQQAILWLRHELIDLRQHDVLLRRQFLNIQNTVESMKQKRKSEELPEEEEEEDDDLDNELEPPPFPCLMRNRSLIIRKPTNDTTINSFDTEQEFRPRTSSTLTARDLAAKARRRDSKELCL